MSATCGHLFDTKQRILLKNTLPSFASSFEATEAKWLRVSVSSFCESLVLLCKVLKEFAPETGTDG